MSGNVDHRKLYRLPWTLPDNAISWLEPTSHCNLTCDGCYRRREGNPHKSLAEMRQELDVLQRSRRSDCVSIAGGDPLVYPDIIPLVREVRARGYKPILNTNGKALTPELLRELKRAGVFGFTFHVDTGQGRGGRWQGKSELDLCELRLRYAEMLAAAGGLACSFNSTVYAENLDQVPGMIRWAQEHIDIVHTMVFICFRHVVPDLPFDWYAGGERVDWDRIWYHSDGGRKVAITSRDLVAKMRETEPEFAPAAYLNGTVQPDALKWLLTIRIGDRRRILGYLGPQLAELATALHHARTGRYLSYAGPRTTRCGRTALGLLWPFDASLRRASRRWLGELVRRPSRALRRQHLQSIMFIQPVDFMADGNQSMCDGCPDITVHEGRLLYSCRLEEVKQFGDFLRTVPRAAAGRAVAEPPAAARRADAARAE